jgi:hypothetical protein
MANARAARAPIDELPSQETGLAEGGKMAVIEESIEISRRPEDAFAFVIDLSHFPEWLRREGHIR